MSGAVETPELPLGDDDGSGTCLHGFALGACHHGCGLSLSEFLARGAAAQAAVDALAAGPPPPPPATLDDVQRAIAARIARVDRRIDELEALLRAALTDVRALNQRSMKSRRHGGARR